MDGPFNYVTYVTGKSNIGRAADAKALAEMIRQGENVVIYEPPKAGKTSLVQQTFINMKGAKEAFKVVDLSLLSIRSTEDLSRAFKTKMLKAQGVSTKEQQEDPQEQTPVDLKELFSMPYRAAQKMGVKIIVTLREFQNVMQTEDGDKVCDALMEVFESRTEQDRLSAVYILTGSKVNAMHEIFGLRKVFFRQVTRLHLSEIDPKDLAEHVLRGYISSGKVIDRDQLLSVCDILRGNIWYINHFAAICDHLTKGYILELTIREALATLIAVHEPRFVATMNDLTTFQVSLLRAILEGNTKFSGVEIIKKYSLNSSANVRRLKDALSKKEIVSFDEEGNPTVIDPLFEYWARKQFYNL